MDQLKVSYKNNQDFFIKIIYFSLHRRTVREGYQKFHLKDFKISDKLFYISNYIQNMPGGLKVGSLGLLIDIFWKSAPMFSLNKFVW